MSKLHEHLQQRAESPEEYEKQITEQFAARKASLIKLKQNKEFKVYLQLEEEMNDPEIVIMKDCSDAVCMALKRKIRDFWKRQRVLAKLGEQKPNGTAPRR